MFDNNEDAMKKIMEQVIANAPPGQREMLLRSMEQAAAQQAALKQALEQAAQASGVLASNLETAAQAQNKKIQEGRANSQQQPAAANTGGAVKTLTAPNGDRYTGEVLNGKPHGKGTYIYKNGERYDGEFRGGKRNGQGIFTFTSGARFEGGWKDSLKHGKGKYSFASGHWEEGEWENDKQIKRFKDFTPDLEGSGDRLYEGEYNAEGKRHGQGVYHMLTTGWKYEGGFRNGDFFGHGVLSSNKGDRMEGSFNERSQLQGHGVQHYADGKRYEGNFELSAKHGKGTIYFLNGDRFEDEFDDGNGVGTLYLKDGSVKKGKWKNEKFTE